MTFTVETRKFCCCLPVRLGVFVLSLVAMAGGGIVGVVGWMSVAALKEHPMEITDEVALYIHSGIFTLLGLLGIIGFVGSLAKSLWMVTSFAIGVAIHLGLSIGSGVFTIYSVFKEPSQQAIIECLQGSTDEDVKQTCQTGMSIVKGVIVAIYVVAWIIELYAYFIVDRYARQLEDEEIARLAPIIPQQPEQHGVNVHPQMMGYMGYPQRFSYSAYAESRRSYVEPRQHHKEFDDDPNDPRRTQLGPNGVVSRPHSEYAFTLPQQAYGVSRGKDTGV